MKNFIQIFTLILFVIFLTNVATFSQESSFVTKTYDFKNFDKINFKNLDGDIEVTVGKSWSIEVNIEKERLPLLQFSTDKSEYTLNIKLKNIDDNYWMNPSNMKVKISMPFTSVITNASNADITITGIVGRYFRYESKGNGTAQLSGTIDTLDIKNSSNANVHAEKLIAKTAEVRLTGNGNVDVHSQISLKAKGSGNGDIIQHGPGEIHPLSGILGNGEVRRK